MGDRSHLLSSCRFHDTVLVLSECANRDCAAYFKVGGGGLTRSLKCGGGGRGWNDSLTRNYCPLFLTLVTNNASRVAKSVKSWRFLPIMLTGISYKSKLY